MEDFTKEVCCQAMATELFLCSGLLGAEDGAGIRKETRIHRGISDHLSLAQQGNSGDVCEEERLHRTFLLLLILGVGTLR